MPVIFFETNLRQPIKHNHKYSKYLGSEDQLQKAVAKYLDMKNSFWFHCPNGGSRHGLEAAKLKQMGVKSGIPDCLILDSKHGYAGLAIELKVGYNKLSDNQIAVISKLIKLNWLVFVSWSLDEVVEAVDWYYGIGSRLQS